ncbi:archease [Planctomycetota bacterium]
MSRGRLAIIDHTADTGLEIEADSLGGVLETAAEGFILLTFGETKVGEGTVSTIELEEDTFEDLTVELLRQLLLRVDAEGLRIFNVQITEALETRCTAAIYEGPIESEEEVELHIKAVTYHGLELTKKGDLYCIRVIFDI